jgi:hypothetical protein
MDRQAGVKDQGGVRAAATQRSILDTDPIHEFA